MSGRKKKKKKTRTFGLVVDVLTGIPVAFIESLKSLRTEKFSPPYPFLLEGSPPKNSSGKVGEMKVDSCVESEEQYVIKITIKCETNISGNFAKKFICQMI